MEGKGGCVGKRGQGCFLFSQLIDSQMSGGVVFVAGLKHPVTLFPTNTTPMHTHACMHHIPVASVGASYRLRSRGEGYRWLCSHL